jgi:hypothetical protein
MMAGGGVPVAADALEVRIARLEGAYEQIDKRLGSIENDIRDLRTEIHILADRLITRMDRQFFWVLGLLVVSIILPIALRLGGR